MTPLRIILPTGLDALVARIIADAHRRRLTVVIDGGSGSGKTTLALRLADRLRPQFPRLQVVGLDDFYPGWHGLAAASETLTRTVLASTGAGYRRWDWVGERPGAWVDLDAGAPILVEGCGALTPASAALASTSIWVERDAAERKALALARDGDGFRPWWDVWAAQEQQHWDSDRPQDLAEVVVEAGLFSA